MLVFVCVYVWVGRRGGGVSSSIYLVLVLQKSVTVASS